MDERTLVLELNEKSEIIRIHRGRQTPIARLDETAKTLFWKNADYRDGFHKSVAAFLEAEKIAIETFLLDGQKPDVVPKNAPPAPEMHFMQGDLTPAYIEWLMKYKPVEFTNRMGVHLRKLEPGEKEPTDIRELWVRADVVRTDSRPLPETFGGEYLSTRFRIRDQIIARRRSHLTFEPKEIDRGDTPEQQAQPYEDPYTPEKLDRMDKKGDIEIVWKRHAAASAGAQF